MKLSLLLVTLFLSSSAFAAIDDIQIHSFTRIGDMMSPMMGEVCGNVNSSDPMIIVKVAVDPGPRQGFYTTLTDKHGNFCITVATHYGRVEVTATGVHDSHDDSEPITDSSSTTNDSTDSSDRADFRYSRSRNAFSRIFDLNQIRSR